MEHLILYYGACLMGAICLISMLAVYKSNRNVLKDLRHPAEAKNPWMKSFIQEHEKNVEENTQIHNPSVYVIKRMRGRKIGLECAPAKGYFLGNFCPLFFIDRNELVSYLSK